jgi:hypothetical protein
VERLLEHVEVLALANPDPRLHFAILSDFVDATSRERTEDAAMLAVARAGIEALNARQEDGRRDRFFLFHRPRLWNPRRGHVDGLGAQARQARGAQQAAARRDQHDLRRQVGDTSNAAKRALLHHARLETPACRATRRRSSSASSRTP